MRVKAIGAGVVVLLLAFVVLRLAARALWGDPVGMAVLGALVVLGGAGWAYWAWLDRKMAPPG